MIDKMRELTDRQMLDFVKELEKRRIPLHSVLIAQHGKLIFEKYYAPYCRNKLQRMFSVTKSFTSLAIGLLEQEGKISLDLTGRKPGRGAYVCRNVECLKLARKARRILSVIIFRNICLGECIPGWQR